MAQDKLDILYDALERDGAVTSGRESFRAKMLSPGEEGYKNRLALFTALKQDNAVESNTYEEFAANLGLHAVKPAKQEDPAEEQGGAAQPNADDYARAAKNNALAVERGRDVLHQAENAQEWQKANFGLNVPKVELGLGKSGRTVATAPTFNAKTGKQERTYITQSGNEYTSQASAEREQAALDKQQEQARKLARVQEEIDSKRQEELAGIDKQLAVMQEQYDRIKGTDQTSETRRGYIMQAIDRLQQQRDAAEKKYRGRDVKAEYELGGGKEQLEAAKEEVASALEDIEKRRGEKSGFMEFAESQFPNVTSYIRRWTDPEYGKAKAAEQALEDTENTIKQVTREGFSNNTAFNVARGAWDATRDIRTWDFGANDWADSHNLAELVDKSERIRKAEEAGKTPEEHLTATEQRVLDAMAVSSTLDANFSEHVPMSYRVGQSVPASAGFAASIYLNLLNGLGAAVEKQVAANAAKGGVKEVLKGAMKTAGKTVMKNVTGAPTMTTAEQSMQRALTVAAVNKYGKWGVHAMNTAGRVIGDGVEALGTTLTTGLPRTMASINERQAGTFIGRVDDSGRIVYDRVEDRETGAKSYLKGGLASYFENQSELVGEYFSPIKNFANLAAKDMPMARSMVERFIASSPKQKASLLAEFRKKAHISGLFGEYAEEVINNLENAVFTGDMNLTGGVFEPKREDYKSDAEYNEAVNKWQGSMFNAETNLETFLSVAAMIMPMAAIEQGQKRYNSYTVKRQLNTSADALRKSLGEETAVPLMTRMREAESIKDICDVYMSALKDGGLKDNKQARALMDYAGKLVAYQSVNTSDMAGEISANRVQRGYKSAFDAGHEMAADERHNAAVEFDNAAATATEMLGKDFVMAVRDMDLPQFQEILKTLSWEQKKAATDVYLSSVRLSGILAGARDRVDEEADKYGNTLNLMSDEEGNAWRGSNLGENEYVVPSSLSDEGSTLVVRDMETGALRMIPREEAGELTAVNTSEETEARRKQLWEQAKDEVRWNLNHHNKTVQPAVGETVSISMRKSEDEESEPQRFLIVKEDEDGNFYLLPTRMNEAGEEEAISGTPFKATADELLSSQDYVYEQEDAAQRDAERSAVEETTDGGASEETPTGGSSVVIEGTPATEEDAPADTAVPTRSEMAVQLDATEEGRSARAMVDGWVRDENDADTIHEWIDLVDESEWDAETKQLLHDYVDSEDAPDEEGPTGGSSVVVESEVTPKIPLGKDGAPQYDKAPIQATVEDLYDGTLDDKEVGEFIEAQIAEADKNVKKLEKRKPRVGTDKAKYLASKKKWEDELEDARHKVQYWNDVKAEVERMTTPADAQGWEGELNDDNARAAYRAQRKAENGIPTQQEFIADFMASAKIAPESFRKETGGGTLEQKQWAGRIAKDGDSIERLSEKLVDLDNTENGGRFFGGDSAAARDAIIDFLKSGRDKTDQEQEFVEQYNAQRDAYYNERYGMSYEDYIAYTEQEMPEMLRRYSNFDEQEFTKLYADEIEEDLRRREEQAKQQSNGTEGNDSAGVEQSDGGSHQVQPGERADDTRGGEERTDTRAEEDAGDEGAGKPEAAQENAGNEGAADGGSTEGEVSQEQANTPDRTNIFAEAERLAEEEKNSNSGGRRKRGGFKSPERKSAEGRFAEEKLGRYSGLYKEVLDSSDTIQEAVQKFVGRLRELADAHKDWSSREYKRNSGVVEAGAKYGELESGRPMRIDAVNEKRREKTLQGIEKEAKEVEGYISTLLERCGVPEEEAGKYFPESERFDNLLKQEEDSSVRLQKADEYSEFASEYGLDGMWLSRYAEGMRERNSAAAAMALHDLKALYLREHISEKKALMERDGISGLLANKRLFEPVEQAIKAKYGDVDVLIEERRKQAEIERGLMEAARKRAEEEEAKRQQHLEELSILTEDEIDERYADALEKGDEETAREMLDEAARRKGYGDVESDYQGVGTWSAPSNPGYESDEARRNAVGESSPELNVEDMAAGYNNQPEDIFVHPDKYSQGLPTSKESGKAIQTAIDDIRNGKKDVKIKVYRAVPASLKEGKLRNGDWVSPSKKYAEMHGNSRLEGKYRIIEDEVPAGDLWWDSNDVNEWGYDNGKGYKYKNTKNNRKLNDLVTHDDKGNIVPPSKRFNSRKTDERYQRGKDAAPVTKEEAILRDAVIDRMRENGMDVITNEEEGQRVLDEANGKVRTQMGDAPESFAERQKQAVENRGIVMPGLNGMSVKVLDGIPRHSYTGNIAEATKQAIQKAKEKYAPDGKAKVLHYDNNGTEFDYTISGNAIEICLSPKHQAKSDNKGAHLALAEHLDEVINHSVEVEEHPDYIKGKDGKRGARINPIALMHRFYGAVVIDGVPCRVMTLMREEKSAATDNGIHSYEVQKIEVLDNELPSTPNGVGSQNQLRLDSSYPLAKLLKGVEKSYDKGKKLLEESEKSSAGIREHRVWHGSGADFEAFGHSHMGEGEGSQAFGWGTYVTNSKDIGFYYATRIDNDPSKRNYLFQRSNGTRFKKKYPTLESFLQDTKRMAINGKVTEQEKIDYYHNMMKLAEPYHNLYTVEIPEDNGKNYLDWDSKVGARVLNKVNRQLEKQGKRPINPELDKRYKILDGNDLYRALSIRMPNDDATFNDDKAASEFLYSLGFVGIKYKAGRNFGGAKEGDTNYVIFNEKDAKITDHVRFFRTADGDAYGFTVDGKIYIDPKIANSETPVHEYAHLWASALRQSNAKEWANVVGLMKDTAVWEEVKKRYPELKTDDEIADEVLATYSGQRGAERLRKEMEESTKQGSIFDKAEAMSAMQKIRQALDTFWKSVADFLHIHYSTAEEVADRVMKDLLDGVDPRRMNDGESLERVNERFNDELDAFKNKSHKGLLHLGRPGAILCAAGIDVERITLSPTVLNRHLNKHGLTTDDLKGLAKSIQSPILVYKHGKNSPNIVVVTELDVKGGKLSASFELDSNGEVVRVSNISSIHNKDAEKELLRLYKMGENDFRNALKWVEKEKVLNWLAPSSYKPSGMQTNEAPFDIAKVIQDFENPKVSDEKVSEDDTAIDALNSEYRGEWLKREGEGQATDEEVSLANDPVSKMIGKSRYSAGQQVEYAENMRERMTTHAQELAGKLHLSNVEIVADGSGFTGKRQKAKGFYNKTTGKITVVIGNHTSMADVEKTILHEAVAHHGLRQLFGEHFDQFLDNVYESCDYKIQQKIDALMEEKGYDQRTATEEYLASLAEDMNYETTDPTFWTAIKEAFLDMLHTLGFDYAGPVLTDNELRYILWRSYKNLEEPGSFRSILGTAEDLKMQETLGVGQYETEGKESAAAEDLYREDDISRALNNDSEGSGWSRETMQRAWDGVMSKASFLAKEGYFDYLASVDEFQKLVERATGEKVSDMQNAYKAMLQLSSRNANEMKLFDSAFARPLQRAVYRLIGAVKDFKSGKGLELSWYLISKHGIERNRDMAIRAAMKEKVKEAYAEQIHEATAELKEERTQLLTELTRIAAGETSTLGTEATIKARVKQVEAEIDSIKKHPNKHGLKTEAEFYEDELGNWYRTASFIKEYAEENGWTWRETQEELTRRAADFGADVTEDYSGLSALVEEEEDFTEAAYRRVENYENAHHTDDLWEAIRAMSGYSLEKQRSSGLTTKKYVDDQLRRYDFFVPLRGWADPTAEEMYDYLDGQRSELGNPVKTAKGRKSEADNPLGGLLSVAYRSIASGNKNMALQHFYNLVSAHNTSGLAVIDSMWIENRGTEDAPDWVLATPELTDPMTGGREMSAEEVQAELDRFNADMREKAALGMAIQMKKGTPLPPYRVTQQHARTHQIRLSVGGTNRVITIVGNPRVAMALNGLLNPENSGWPILRKLNNFMAGAFTNYNVSFGGANLARDTAHSNLRAFIDESPAYWWALTKKQNLLLGNAANWARMVGMMRKYEAGKPMTGYHERMFKEFMDGGGATGYTMIRNQKESTQFMVDMVRDLKNLKRRKLSPMRMFEFFSFLNEAAELVNRFVAYETSREMGRTKERSIDDAKEATLNFNRKGAGAKSLTQREGAKYRLSNALNYYSQYGRSFIVFFNAHVQGTYQLYRLVKAHPAKFAFAFGAAPITAAAVALPLFNNLLLPAIYSAVGGDGDDEWGDYYAELSDWERQHNICLRLPKGHGWLKIPLTPELGAMFQVGDVTGASFAGKRDMQASDFAGLMELVAPNNVDFTDAGTAISSLVPSSLQWASHIAVNRDFKGSRLRNDNMFSRYQPEYLKATRSTSATIIAMSRALNKVGGGNDERSADNVLDFSPGYVQEMLTGIAGGWASTALAVSDALVAPYLEGGGSEKDYWKGAKGLFDRGGVPVLSRFWISGSGERIAARAKGEYMRTVKPFMGATESEFSLIKRIPRPAALNVRAKEEKLEAAKKSHDLFAIAEAEKALEVAKANFEEAKKTQRQKLDALQGSERFKAYRDMRGITRYIDYMLRLYKDNDLPDNVVDSLQEANRRLLEVEK